MFSPAVFSGGGGPNFYFNSALNSSAATGGEAPGTCFAQGSRIISRQCVPISMSMEISPIHHSMVLGKVFIFMYRDKSFEYSYICDIP